MTITDCEAIIRVHLDSVTKTLGQFIADEMEGMSPAQYKRFNAEVSRSIENVSKQISVQNERMCFWIRRVLQAKESTK